MAVRIRKRLPLKVCLTGGPEAGKTSACQVLVRQFGKSLSVIPESASLLYGGGLARARNGREMRIVQDIIYQVQVRAEDLGGLRAGQGVKVLVCDRGTFDGFAHWPATCENFLSSLKTTLRQEFGRYDVVIHMESARKDEGYELSNLSRTESDREAHMLDKKIRRAWNAHPRHHFVSNRESFLEKAREVVAIVKKELSSQ